MERKDLLFKKVNVMGYYKTAKDGVKFEINQDKRTVTDLVFDTPIEETALTEIGDRVKHKQIKSKFVHTEKCFSGIVVGEKNILVSYDLEAEKETDMIYISRVNRTYKKCLIVYYEASHKRYVPVEDIIEDVK